MMKDDEKLTDEPSVKPAFKWSEEQSVALDAIERWGKRRDEQLFRLFGYAGTGKTTVVKEIARRAGGNVKFAAFTGKAALVMRRMGCTGAVTIHSQIYTPLSELVQEAKAIKAWLANQPSDAREAVIAHNEAMERWSTADPEQLTHRLMKLRAIIEQGPSWNLREKLDPKPSMFIIDEVSMVNEALGRDLMSFGIPVLVIGDPFQLPPVEGCGYFTEGVEPDAMLTQIHRQAWDSPITRMATEVRQRGAYVLKLGEYGESRYVSQSIADSVQTMVDADQVLCGMHRTRRIVNSEMRSALGYWGDIPLPGERIICKRNSKNLRLLNGGMWIVKECEKHGTDTLRAKIVSVDDDSEREVIMHAEPFRGEKVLPEDKFDAQEFDWAYAITGHASQGSQWRHVVVINDGFGSWEGGDLRDRWLYTALTRAQERVTVIKPQAKAQARPARNHAVTRTVTDLKTARSRKLSERR